MINTRVSTVWNDETITGIIIAEFITEDSHRVTIVPDVVRYSRITGRAYDGIYGVNVSDLIFL